MKETFAKPSVAAIIEKTLDGEKYIVIQTRQKEDGGDTNGLLEIPAGKIREYENIFDALRREVMEETGLSITNISGENLIKRTKQENGEIITFQPFCVTQNLSGVYSLVLNTFICEAKGTMLESTNETTDIRWICVKELRLLLQTNPDKFFIMHVNALKKYLGIE